MAVSLDRFRCAMHHAALQLVQARTHGLVALPAPTGAARAPRGRGLCGQGRGRQSGKEVSWMLHCTSPPGTAHLVE